MLCLFLRTSLANLTIDWELKIKKIFPKTAEIQLMSSIKKTLNLIKTYIWSCCGVVSN